MLNTNRTIEFGKIKVRAKMSAYYNRMVRELIELR